MANAQNNTHIAGWTGWVSFACALMLISGIIHVMFGLGGILSQDWYLYASGNVLLFDSSVWGWSMLAGGILLFFNGILLLAGNMVGRIIGVLLMLMSLIVNIAMFPATPVWSVVAIILNIFILYAITAHGSEMKHLEDGI